MSQLKLNLKSDYSDVFTALVFALVKANQEYLRSRSYHVRDERFYTASELAALTPAVRLSFMTIDNKKGYDTRSLPHGLFEQDEEIALDSISNDDIKSMLFETVISSFTLKDKTDVAYADSSEELIEIAECVISRVLNVESAALELPQGF